MGNEYEFGYCFVLCLVLLAMCFWLGFCILRAGFDDAVLKDGGWRQVIAPVAVMALFGNLAWWTSSQEHRLEEIKAVREMWFKRGPYPTLDIRTGERLYSVTLSGPDLPKPGDTLDITEQRIFGIKAWTHIHLLVAEPAPSPEKKQQ